MLDISEDDVLYTCLPLFHTNALNAFVQALVAGATYHLGPRFSASRFWGRLAESGATVTYLLGAMVNILMSSPEGPHDRAHTVRDALAPATSPSIFDRFRDRFGIQLVEGYGSTETNCPIAVSWERQRGGWMGQVRAGFDARVVDAHDEEVPDGSPGELVLRNDPPFAFATGYFRDGPRRTVEAWRNLWFHTGDQVVRDPDGWFRFTDRIKDAIRRRGENISSFEVEQALLLHADVSVGLSCGSCWATPTLPSPITSNKKANDDRNSCLWLFTLVSPCLRFARGAVLPGPWLTSLLFFMQEHGQW